MQIIAIVLDLRLYNILVCPLRTVSLFSTVAGSPIYKPSKPDVLGLIFWYRTPSLGASMLAQTPHFLGRTSTVVIGLLFWHFLSRDGGLDHTRSLPLLPVLRVLLYIFGSGGLVAKLCPTLATPRTVACQAPLSMGFSRQNTAEGCHFLLQGIFPSQGLNLGLLNRRCILS